VKRSGFSLVELVFSIVIIAIALMTAPLMLNQSAKSNQYALMQESILAARTKMGNILSFKWDENTFDKNGTVFRVIDVTDGDSELDRNTTADKERRRGHVYESKRRRMVSTAVNATIVQEGGVDEFDDIDDFDNKTAVIAVTSATGKEGDFDYLDKDLNLTTTVTFLSDAANYSDQNITFDFNVNNTTADVNSTNIKMVELNATSTNNDLPFVFRIFSSNIGQAKLYEKEK